MLLGEVSLEKYLVAKHVSVMTCFFCEMTTHLIRRDAAFPTSPPPFDIEGCLLYVRPHPTYPTNTPSSGGLHSACTPRSGLLRVFVDETIQEMRERVKG
jgi:hypothetical protein